MWTTWSEWAVVNGTRTRVRTCNITETSTNKGVVECVASTDSGTITSNNGSVVNGVKIETQTDKNCTLPECRIGN